MTLDAPSPVDRVILGITSTEESPLRDDPSRDLSIEIRTEPAGPLEAGDEARTTVEISNDGSSDRSLFLGYGVRPKGGNEWLDNDDETGHAITVPAKGSKTASLTWEIRSDHPTGTYDIAVQTWAETDRDNLQTPLVGKHLMDAFEVEAVESNRPPSAVLQAPPETSVRDRITLDASQSSDPDGDDLSYEWSTNIPSDVQGIPEGSTDADTIEVTPGLSGAFAFTVTVSDGQHSASDSVDVTVEEEKEDPNDPPTAVLDVEPSNPPPGSPVQLEATASSDPDGQIETYAWTADGQDVGQGPQITHAFDEPGEHTASLTVTDDDGLADTATETLAVQPRDPTASFTRDCQGLSCTFDASQSSDPDGDVAAYEWTFGDGATATGPTVDHEYDAAGGFPVELTVVGPHGATDSDQQTVEVGSKNAAPTAALELDPAQPRVPDTVTLDSAPSADPDGSIQQAEWAVDGTALGTGRQVTHSFETPEIHTVELTVTDDDGALDQQTRTVTVRPSDPEPEPQPEPVALALTGEDGRFQLDEVQTAIDLWAEDEPVPGTDGATLTLDQVQRFIDAWAEDRPIGPEPSTGGASR
jgi:PKD repeat protein